MSNSQGLGQEMRQYRRMFKKAINGDRAAINNLIAANDLLSKQVNKQLRVLERKGFAYGAAYNQLTYFTQTEYDTNRLKTSKQLGYDPIDIITQIEQAVKYQHYKSSTLEGQEEILQNKKARLIEMEVVPENISNRQIKSFVKFLGNEETREIVEEYGDSDVVIDMMYDAFTSRKNTIQGMKIAFQEYMAKKNSKNAIGFDELMERLGVDVYNSKYRWGKSDKYF